MSNLTIIQTPGTARYYRKQLGNSIELEMVLVKGGTFTMGSPQAEEGHNSNEKPQHEVIVPTFFLGRYPVTQEQWQIVAETYPKVKIDLNPKPSRFESHRRPVEQVSWYEAEEFCARLASEKKRLYLLPSEAEWEFACRAGTTTPFNFGKTLSSELANYNNRMAYLDGSTGKPQDETTPVDHFNVANAWGLCDMHGNVWEWCQDHWYQDYNNAPTDGSAWLSQENTSLRVVRGGSWYADPRDCRSAYRNFDDVDHRNTNMGFRMACSAPGL
jgi:formylglycine-generating enzyme required for sulfatase activity